MIFQRVLFFNVVLACQVLLSFTQSHSKGIFSQAINTKSYHLHQDQLELPRYNHNQGKRIRRDAIGSVEEGNEKINLTQSSNADEDEEKNEAQQKQRVCKGLPLCGRRNGDRRRLKRSTVNVTNGNLKKRIDQLINLEHYRHNHQVDEYIRSVVNLRGIKGKNVNQLNGEEKLGQANCLGWFRRQGSSSTTSSSVGAAGEAADGGDADTDTGGDAGDSNLQTSRRLRATRRTTTTRRSRHN